MVVEYLTCHAPGHLAGLLGSGGTAPAPSDTRMQSVRQSRAE